MLIALEIENLKGIADRQRIDLAPLTLLFGANSAGKSTILHALLYLHELIERGNADVDRTELGGHVVELGGFARLVHRHDIERAIVLRAEFETPGSLDRFGRSQADFPFPDLDDQLKSGWLEIVVRHRQTATFRGPVIDTVTIGANGVADPLVRVENGQSLRSGEPLYIQVNLGHPVVASLRTSHPLLWPALEAGRAWEGVDESAQEERRQLESTIDALSSVAVSSDLLISALGPQARAEDVTERRWKPFFAVARSRAGALPSITEPLRLISAGDVEGDKEELAALRRRSPIDEKRVKELERSISEREHAAEHVRTLLEMIVLGTTAQLASFLRESPYIGPLRTVPPRGFLYERVGRIASWADGLAAWDLLLADRLTLVERTNSWLRRLQAGCQVVVQELGDGGASAEELAEGHVDRTVRRLLLDTGAGSYVLPSEVGAGISQLIPVVVAAIEVRGGLALMEQPEIHVHPAVQVGLGDLFIEGVAGEGRKRMLLVETHSEHLILRLLRRIRQTTEGELAEEEPGFTREKLSVQYVEATPAGVRVRRLRIDEQGEFVDRWPKGFFAERMEELL